MAALGGGALVAAAIFVALPLPEGLLAERAVASVRILDRDGGLLRELPSRQEGRSLPLASAELPEHLQAAFLAAEDKGFFHHLGLSPTAIVRAALQNLEAGRVVAGGSTITQQLARALVPRERTLLGKLQEALWAVRLELHCSKPELLRQYLNRVSFGNNTFGVGAAAEVYFGRAARHLSLAQAATLAAIPRGPSTYNPRRQSDRLEARKQWVLSRLLANGTASPEAVASARTEPIDLTAFAAAFRAPHAVDFVAAHLQAWGLGEATVVETTLDPRLQQQVEEQIHEELGRLDGRRVSSAAALVVDNRTGEVLAYQGSGDFFDAGNLGQNDGVQMRRQPGSALKPFVYLEALRRDFTAATVLADVETSFSGNQGAYAPKNYDRRAHGPVRVREALANSYNVPAVRVADALGVQRLLDVLHRAGFSSLDQSAEHYGLGLALGSGEVSLWEAARAYSGLSRGAVLQPLKLVRRALRSDGAALPVLPELQARRFGDAQAAALVTHILSDNVARARAFGLDNALRLPFPAAAKTGTSKGYSDNWAVGYTRERTVAVWAGNFDGTPMIQVSGITGAGPIFKRVLSRAMAGVVSAPLVDRDGLETVRICPLSGRRAGPQCPHGMEELFRPGSAPTAACENHRALAEQLEGTLAQACDAAFKAEGRVLDVGSDFYEWAHREGLAEEPWLAPACSGARAEEGPGPGVALLSPRAGDEFMLLDDLPLGDQAIPLRVRAAPGVAALEVRLDGVALLTLRAPFTGRFAPRKGEHLLSLHLPGEAQALTQVRFKVRSEPTL